MPWAITKWSLAQQLIGILWLQIKFTYKTHLRAYQIHHPQIDILVSFLPLLLTKFFEHLAAVFFCQIAKEMPVEHGWLWCEMRYAPPINAEIADCSEGGKRSKPWVWHEAARSPANVKAFCPTSAAIELAMLPTLATLIHQMNCNKPSTMSVVLHCGKLYFRGSVTASIRLVHTLYEVSRRIYHWTKNLDP